MWKSDDLDRLLSRAQRVLNDGWHDELSNAIAQARNERNERIPDPDPAAAAKGASGVSLLSDDDPVVLQAYAKMLDDIAQRGSLSEAGAYMDRGVCTDVATYLRRIAQHFQNHVAFWQTFQQKPVLPAPSHFRFEVVICSALGRRYLDSTHVTESDARHRAEQLGPGWHVEETCLRHAFAGDR